MPRPCVILLAVPPSARRTIVAWTLYDFANSAFAAIVLSTVYPAYYAGVVVGNADGRGDFWWGSAVSTAMVIGALTVIEGTRPIAAVAPKQFGFAEDSAQKRMPTIQATAKAAILSTLPINGFKGISMSVIPTVVAWTNQPIERITVNGAIPRSYAETGVVLTVPVEHVSKGSLPAGVIAGRFVDIDGDVLPQGGQPGLVVLQNGSITFDFAPNLESGLHLTSASIVSSNPFGAKGIPANGVETGSVAHAQVWDWAQSRWIAVTYADNASTAVPDSAVNPANGQVRLKLSSDSGFTSGWLSLAGEAK